MTLPVAHHAVYRNLARVRGTDVPDVRRRFPTIAAIRRAYGVVLVEIWAVGEIVPPADGTAP